MTNRRSDTEHWSVPITFKVIAAITFTIGALATLASFLLILGGEGVLRIGGMGLLLSGIGLVRGGADLLAARGSALMVLRASVALVLATFTVIAFQYSDKNLADSLKLLGVVGLVILVIYAGADAHIRQELEEKKSAGNGK